MPCSPKSSVDASAVPDCIELPTLPAARDDGRLSAGIEILAGDLFELSLAALLHLAQYEALTGWLIVGVRGEITWRKGQVTGARSGGLRGFAALKELLFHRGGRFSLRRGEPEPSAEAPLNPTHAIMEAYRLRDEWARLAPLVLAPPRARPWQPAGEAIDAIAAKLDSRRTLGEVVRAQVAMTPVVDALLQAVAQGRLERIGHVRQAAPSIAAGVDFYELVERARGLIREDALEAARALLLQAQALRPDDRVVQQNLRALAQRLRQS